MGCGEGGKGVLERSQEPDEEGSFDGLPNGSLIPMLDENWTPSDEYPAALYFHCPNTNCDGHVKLRDRSRHHAGKCEKCGLQFAIGADPELRKGGRRSLLSAFGFDCRVLLVLGLVLGLLVGILIALRFLR